MSFLSQGLNQLRFIIFILSLQGCGQGYYSKQTGRWTEARTCTKCAIGTYSDTDIARGCIQCPIGTYSDTEAARHCIQCPIGTYSDTEAARHCIQCPPGQNTTGEGSSECQHGENIHFHILQCRMLM